jgi:hypothetical protein
MTDPFWDDMGSKRVLRARQRPAMRTFIDFEFHEDGTTIMPISLGIAIDADGDPARYIEFAFDEERVRRENPWVTQNVLPHLEWAPSERLDFEEAKIAIYNTIGTDSRPSFWAYFADYDWVCFCRLWGRMIDLPSHFPQFCMDVRQLYEHLGRPDGCRPPDPLNPHHALADARWALAYYRNLMAHARSQDRRIE